MFVVECFEVVIRRVRRSDHPEVQQHLHDDKDVTRERLNAFVHADDATQLRVLAELRARSADQETSLLLTLEAAGVAVIAVMLSVTPHDVFPAPPKPDEGWISYVVFLIVCITLGAFAMVILLPSIWHAVVGNRNHTRAVVWLAAYEHALQERPRTWLVRRSRRSLRTSRSIA